MKQAWFKQFGWGFIPVQPMGYFVTLLALLFMVPIVMAIDRNAHSVTDELYQIFVYASCVAFWWKWNAEKTTTK